MSKRICISALIGALVVGLLFFAGCQTPAEIAEVEAARASARAALENSAASPATAAGDPGSVVTLKSTSGTVQRASQEAAASAVPVQPPAAPTAVEPVEAASAVPQLPAAETAEDAPVAATADPYARAAVGTDFELLRLGSEGPLVERLHLYLSELGYLPAASGSYFGPETEEAVTALQRRNSLDADGIVGNSTWDLLLMSNARPAA